MKACPSCQRLYADDAEFCPFEGSGLKPVAEVPVPPDPEDPRIGQSVCNGRYTIRRKVADGGMGRVYQALDLQTQRNVAVKVLHREVAMDDVSVERFKREYQFSAQLPHGHIVEVLDFQPTADNSWALVMEYLEGEELRTMLKRLPRLEPARVVRMLSQAAVGLTEPHKRDIVHRDIKPDNVFMCGTADGPVVKILDFGSVRDNSADAKKLTMIGTTIGSPYYMSPEQAQGLPELDHRADVWSLAAIGYECLTGELPFKGRTGPQILLAILGEEPKTPTAILPSLPAAVDDVFWDGLAKLAAQRVPTVGQLADRLGHAFGLTGGHLDWAYLPESNLAAAIAAAPPPVVAPPFVPQQAGFPMQQASESHDDNSFAEDDLVMGVPQGPPKALLWAGVVVFLALVAVAVYLAVT